MALMAGVLLWLSRGNGTNTAGSQASRQPAGSTGTTTSTDVDNNRSAEKPKISGSAAAADAEKPKSADAKNSKDVKAEPQNFGRAEPVPGNLNPQTKSVQEALKTHAYPERLTAMIQPTSKFDKAKFDASPTDFLNLVEPGRVFLTAEPGSNVPQLKPSTPTYVQIKQGESTKLTVVSAPNYPVTFTSFDMGKFLENELNSVTVKADKDGVASATFSGSSGTLNDVRVLAGSPMASGQVRFVVDVQDKGELGTGSTLKK